MVAAANGGRSAKESAKQGETESKKRAQDAREGKEGSRVGLEGGLHGEEGHKADKRPDDEGTRLSDPDAHDLQDTGKERERISSIG